MGPKTMGHYSEHLAANASAGVNHLTPPRASLANNYGVKSAAPTMPMAQPTMMTRDSVFNEAGSSNAPKDTVFGAAGK